MRRSWLVALAIASVLAGACGQTQADTPSKPAEVVPVPGTNVSRIVLTTEAAGRVGLQTAPVQTTPGAAASVPLAAVVYDREGATWVYARTAPLTFQRERVTVARVVSGSAILQAGPAPGTDVVTVGAAELLGSEYGVEGE
jgi:hypothetical protein